MAYLIPRVSPRLLTGALTHHSPLLFQNQRISTTRLFYQCHYTVLGKKKYILDYDESISWILSGVHRQASKEDIEAAYFEKIKGQTHLNGNLKEETKVILRAYETLSDDDTRKVYDKQFSEVDDFVKSASVGEAEFRNRDSDSPLGSGGRKLDGFSDKLDHDQMNFAVRALYMTFAIITFPKIIYMGWQHYKGELNW